MGYRNKFIKELKKNKNLRNKLKEKDLIINNYKTLFNATNDNYKAAMSLLKEQTKSNLDDIVKN